MAAERKSRRIFGKIATASLAGEDIDAVSEKVAAENRILINNAALATEGKGGQNIKRGGKMRRHAKHNIAAPRPDISPSSLPRLSFGSFIAGRAVPRFLPSHHSSHHASSKRA
jgi:hypothetical protein